MKFDTHKKEQGRQLDENGAGINIVGHSKLKLLTFSWGHGECEWYLTLLLSFVVFKTTFHSLLYIVRT